MTTAAAVAPRPVGSAGSRLRDPFVVGVFAGAFLGLLALAVLVVWIGRPGAPRAPCPGVGPCPARSEPLVTTAWRSPAFGFGLEYARFWTLAAADGAGLELRHGSAVLTVRGVRSSDAQAALDQRLQELRGDLRDLAANSLPERRLLGPNVGYRDGVGGAYCGTTSPPQGAGKRVDALVMAATDGTISIVATVLSDDCTKSPVSSLPIELSDSVLNTVRWPGEPGPGAGASAGARMPPSRPGLAARRQPPLDRRLAPTAGAERLSFALTLRLPRECRLDRDLRAAADRRSDAGRPLTAAGFGRRYGLPLARIARLRRQLARAGIRVEAQYPQRTALAVSATVRSVSRLFSVSVSDFRDRASGRRYHAPVGRIRIPRAIADAVAGVSGLSNRPLFEPAAVPAKGLKPIDAARAYDVTPLWDMGIRGRGQTVAIESGAPFADSDVALFDKIVGIKNAPKVERVRVRGQKPRGDFISRLEIALDIAIVRGVAPQAQIIAYEDGPTITGTTAMINQVVAEGRTKIVSISAGRCDVPNRSWSAADRQAAETAARAAVRTGISIFASSGDYGAYGCQNISLTNAFLATQWPADDPNVVGVGGTLLGVRPDGGYLDEAGWEDVLSDGGTGGGLNPLDARPAWQRAPGVDNSFSNGRRQVPDVSASGDPDSGFFFVLDGRPFRVAVGGTSASTPFWAGSTALVAQFAARAGAKRPLRYVNPLLYELASTPQPYPPFHDVVRGGNRYYDATPGWDYATGLGSPDVYNLARDVAARLGGG